jgi:hypothetical protein
MNMQGTKETNKGLPDLRKGKVVRACGTLINPRVPLRMKITRVTDRLWLFKD